MKKRKILFLILPVIILLGLLIWYLSTHNIAVLNPAGQVADKERHLMIIAILLSAIVVIPVFFFTILIAVRYREGNKKAKYSPDWDSSRLFESIWWGVPIAIIIVLSVITWNSTHALDPYKPLASNNPAIPVEVVALDWKWLFIYPDQGVASINRLEMPLNTPLHFYLTSDTVMNSFWIPSLGSQIYAMPGMTTQLNLVANKLGSFYGSSANISGAGFAGMNFYADSVKNQDFKLWVNNAKNKGTKLNYTMYNKLAHPSQYNPVAYYSDPAVGLFSNIVNKYMTPSTNNPVVD